MPTSKSSTSTEPDYKAMLDELLQVVNKDYGHYVILAGYPAALENAKYAINDERRRLRNITARFRELTKKQ